VRSASHGLNCIQLNFLAILIYIELNYLAIFMEDSKNSKDFENFPRAKYAFPMQRCTYPWVIGSGALKLRLKEEGKPGYHGGLGGSMDL
jgi:hypothetical protein